MEALTQLQSSISNLLARLEALQMEVLSLRQENQNLKQEVMHAHHDLTDLQARFYRLQTAASLAGDAEQRERAKQQINYLIQQVDQVLEVLKQA